ncbi:tetratricopeptide repeat domain protein [Coleofasciculus chthonoplastes PCC 7420]|uniref:Tetratricopeptide repeat domain protein n=1 Tax=Coleofasciculus chthonoplastes PCC 7420 TaxID=118168 RepID=B4VRD6_9CYAN|nr:CHAT domain-containing protein [Coleofasciculus chthonoplastes]EDX75499.1 tetratricopeptide repeat domain protein [Coleofasciculus chthonoplastes PCC 7420]
MGWLGRRARKRLLFLGLAWLTVVAVIASPVALGNASTLLQSDIIQQDSHLAQSLDPVSRLSQGKTDYDRGRFADAVLAWQEAEQVYQQAGDRTNQAISLNYLSLAYQHLGQWEQAKAAIEESLNLLPTPTDPALLAQVLNTKGSLQLATGQSEAALQTWKAAETAYSQDDDAIGVLGCQINQAQALQSLGMFRRSQQVLERVQQALTLQPDSLIKATGLRSLGMVWQAIGELDDAQNVLNQSLAIAQTLNSPADISAAFLNLGNTARVLGDRDAAINYYHKAAKTATNPLNQLEAQLNQFKLLISQQPFNQSQDLFTPIQHNLSQLSPSRYAIYAQVNWAESLIELLDNSAGYSPESITSEDIAQLLAKTIAQAKALNDTRAESLALGTLGKLYKTNQQGLEAQRLIQQALFFSKTINARDISYQWQWQLTQLYQQNGDLKAAITANQDAFDLLQSIRGDLVAMNPDVRFSFQEQIEPIYRNLVRLLLQSSSPDNLKQARNVIESLQLAELENYFRTSCLNAKAEQIDTVIEDSDTQTAVIYPIILPDRIAVILSLPGQPLETYNTELSQAEIEQTVNQLRQSMNIAYSNRKRLAISQTIYDWLIRPIETQLAQQDIKTLVFVLDGVLRNVPMAALHDGQQYLIEKYSIALTPGLQLLEPRSLTQFQLRSLTAGLSQARLGFSALPAVEDEIEQVSTNIPSNVLLNQAFTSTALENKINTLPVSVVHLATHGQFSSNPEDTFILTWDKRFNANTLSQLLKGRNQDNFPPIELLVLSACQTANGDQRAALGLAGLAVRSGTRSTIGTLWSVKDQSTAQAMIQLYNNLTQPDINRAEALRQAQLFLLRQNQYQHPYYWAPFILVGNWL